FASRRTQDSRAPRAPGATPHATDTPCPTLLLLTPRPLLPATSLAAGGALPPGTPPALPRPAAPAPPTLPPASATFPAAPRTPRSPPDAPPRYRPTSSRPGRRGPAPAPPSAPFLAPTPASAAPLYCGVYGGEYNPSTPCCDSTFRNSALSKAAPLSTLSTSGAPCSPDTAAHTEPAPPPGP